MEVFVSKGRGRYRHRHLGVWSSSSCMCVLLVNCVAVSIYTSYCSDLSVARKRRTSWSSGGGGFGCGWVGVRVGMRVGVRVGVLKLWSYTLSFTFCFVRFHTVKDLLLLKLLRCSRCKDGEGWRNVFARIKYASRIFFFAGMRPGRADSVVRCWIGFWGNESCEVVYSALIELLVAIGVH